MLEEKIDTKMIGEFIRKTRKAQKLSQEDLAAMSKTGRRVISELENGKETVELGKVLSILTNLGIGLKLIKNWKE
jgi:HTH-type transcriptional regulator / antitoxin HipB